MSVSACLPAKQFYWGSYEDSLYSRQQHAGANGEAEAASMLLATINEPQADNGKVGPGIHADYGFLLFKQGRTDEAIAELQKESALYPESKPLMETMFSRIQGRKDKEKEKKPAP
ncbi:MAG TPA: DUF4810 domain-containing protein [Nitrospiraceae bacterium]|nr:DUF4810 domain-containing protein [Nitrospiraceae bacterium]